MIEARLTYTEWQCLRKQLLGLQTDIRQVTKEASVCQATGLISIVIATGYCLLQFLTGSEIDCVMGGTGTVSWQYIRWPP